MRTIKFKGLRVDGKGWAYGCLVVDPWGKSRIYYKPFDEATDNTYQFVTPETVGQFTGLIDVDAKEIYEGDTVRAPWHFTKNEVVSLSFDESFFYRVQEYGLEDVLRITGNIHEK